MLTQRSAAIVATSSTAAPPISVSTNSRSGVCRLRAQAVRPANGAGGCEVATTWIVPAAGQPSPSHHSRVIQD